MSHDTEEIWYFAYGSNLSVVDEKRKGRGNIHEAVPCRLPDYRLTFSKLGRDGTCKANITPDPAAEVWGVAYLCDREAMAELDHSEGVDDGHYEHLVVKVHTRTSGVLEAITYTAGPEYLCEEGPPREDYARSIIHGARHHGLPEDYIRSLALHVQRLARAVGLRVELGQE